MKKEHLNDDHIKEEPHDEDHGQEELTPKETSDAVRNKELHAETVPYYAEGEVMD